MYSRELSLHREDDARGGKGGGAREKAGYIRGERYTRDNLHALALGGQSRTRGGLGRS